MPITKHNFVVRDIADLAPSLRRAFEIAREGRCGAVLVDIPKNILTQKTNFTKPRKKKSVVPKVRKNEIQKLAALINSSNRPLVYYGGGVIASGASELLHAFCTSAHLPACHTLMGSGALPSNCVYNFGLAGMHGRRSVAKAIDECDLLIALGTRFSDRVALSGKDFAHEAKRVHIDIDDAEISKNVRISLGIQADVGDVLAQLDGLVEKKERTQWLRHLQKLRTELDHSAYAAVSGFSPLYIIDKLAQAAKRGRNYRYRRRAAPDVDGAALPLPPSENLYHVGRSRHNGLRYGGGCRRAARPAPDKQVFLITGDGSFHMDLTELSTAVRYGAAVKVIVMDNESLGMVRQWQSLHYGARFAETDETSGTDFAALARAFGAQGAAADTCAAFDAALAEAVKSDTPFVIHCKIDKAIEVEPLLCESGGHILMR